MHRFLLILLAVGFALTSCKKDEVQPIENPPPGESEPAIDSRNSIIGDYIGYRVYTNHESIPNQFDTVPIATVTLTKSAIDSVIDVTFDLNYINLDISFKYVNGEFAPTTGYHPPIMTKTNDSIYYKHLPALGAVWFEYFVVKVP